MAQVTFEELKTESKLFEELQSGKYSWWEDVKSNKNLYIDVRKDNKINVYYEGGSVMKLHYCSKHKKVHAFTHKKYLYREGKGYEECADVLDDKMSTIIGNIEDFYSQKKSLDKESWSEAYIKGHIITNSPNHLDSEFAYTNDDINLQIDLVECENGTLRFVELKRIGDNRLLNKDETLPEVVSQIKKYRDFIPKYEKEIIKYYQKIWKIKCEILKLRNMPPRPERINSEPLLLIFNNWTKSNDGRRKNRLSRIEEILKKAEVDYIIKSEI